MQPPQQPMGAPQPYYGYPQQPQQPAAAAMPMMINKKIVFVIIALGALLLWIGQLGIYSFGVTDPGIIRAFRALVYTGAGIGLVGSVLGALGSPRTDPHQNLGLLILAGFFALVLG